MNGRLENSPTHDTNTSNEHVWYAYQLRITIKLLLFAVDWTLPKRLHSVISNQAQYSVPFLCRLYTHRRHSLNDSQARPDALSDDSVYCSTASWPLVSAPSKSKVYCSSALTKCVRRGSEHLKAERVPNRASRAQQAK